MICGFPQTRAKAGGTDCLMFSRASPASPPPPAKRKKLKHPDPGEGLHFRAGRRDGWFSATMLSARDQQWNPGSRFERCPSNSFLKPQTSHASGMLIGWAMGVLIHFLAHRGVVERRVNTLLGPFEPDTFCWCSLFTGLRNPRGKLLRKGPAGTRVEPLFCWRFLFIRHLLLRALKVRSCFWPSSSIDLWTLSSSQSRPGVHAGGGEVQSGWEGHQDS